MKYHIYKVIQDDQEEYDIAVVNAADAFYVYDLYVDGNCHNHYIDTVECTNTEVYDLDEVKGKNYYAELANGIIMFFKQEVNLYKWLYEYCGNQSFFYNFEVVSYGKLEVLKKK